MSTPSLDWLSGKDRRRRAIVRPPAMVTALECAVPHWKPLLMYMHVVHAKLRVLSLSLEEDRSTFGVMARIWAKFQGITKGKWSRHQSLGFSNV